MPQSSTHQGLKERLMKRKVVSLFIFSLPLLLVTLFLHLSVAAAPMQQTIPVEDPATPLAQPQQINIRQQIPLFFTVAVTTPLTDSETSNLLGALISSLNQADALTSTFTVQTVGITLTFDLQLTVTDTLTTTVPSTVTLTWGDQQTTTMPISVTVGALPAAEVSITLLASPALSATGEITPSTTVSLTEGSELTPTAPITAVTGITGTLAFTVNLRSGPDTTFDAVGTIPGGQTVTIVARNADSSWYLLNNGLWVAAFLVENATGDVPLATDALVTTLRAQTPITATVAPTATTLVTTTPVLTETAVVTATETATETAPLTATSPILVPTPAAVTPPAPLPSVTVNANLRSGPATTFPVTGGTTAGQTITIVARNEDGTWFQLDNGGWVSAALVANPPAAASLPLFNAEGTAGATATPTPVPTPTTVTTTTVLGVRENLYIIRVDGLVDGYDLTLNTIDELVTRASANEALLQDSAWITEMTTALALLRSTGDEVGTLSAPALFATPHALLVEAATSFTSAADLLAEGVDALDTDRLDEAFAQITVGTTLLTRVQDEIEDLTP